jgi:hypothetical protein
VRRAPWLRVVAGLLLLALAIAAAFLAHGVGAAASAFRGTQAEWQRGLAPGPATEPGRARRLGEILLGVDGRSDVLRAYQDYRAGLADVIPGTRYPQTRARYEAVTTLKRLRSTLSRPEDRASADVALGVIFTAGATESGQQRAVQTRYALEAFRRAVLEDPANATAKLDLEVLLRSEAERAQARARPSAGVGGNPRQRRQDPRGPTAPAREEGTGY